MLDTYMDEPQHCEADLVVNMGGYDQRILVTMVWREGETPRQFYAREQRIREIFRSLWIPAALKLYHDGLMNYDMTLTEKGLMSWR